MDTQVVSHPKGLSVVALVVGVVSLVATIVYAIVSVSTPFTVASATLGGIAVILGFVALSRHSTRAIAVAAIIVGAASILLALFIIFGTVSTMSPGGGGGYTY